MILKILLSSEPIGERVFIGILTGILSSIVIYFYKRNKNREASREYVKEVKKEIVSESQIALATDNSKISVSCYSNLYTELKEKCNPANFLDPYVAEKVEVSNSIFSQLDSNQSNTNALIRLRNLAIEKLGVSFSAKEIYDKLSEAYNPRNFIGEHYDAEKLHVANQIFSKIQLKKNDIVGLEEIARDCGIVFVDNEAEMSMVNTEDTSNDVGMSVEKQNLNALIFVFSFALLIAIICIISIIIAGAKN